MNIRRDKTNYNPDKDPNNWTNEMYHDGQNYEYEAEQKALVNSWKNIWNSGDEARIEEMDLARRISAVTEGDTPEERVQEAIKEFKAGQLITEKLQALAPQGQSIEEFEDETERFGAKYRRIVREARQEVGL